MHINSSWLSFIGSLLTVATVTVVAFFQVAAAMIETSQDFPQRGIVAIRQMARINSSRVSIDKEGSPQQNSADCPDGSPRPCSVGGSR